MENLNPSGRGSVDSPWQFMVSFPRPVFTQGEAIERMAAFTQGVFGIRVSSNENLVVDYVHQVLSSFGIRLRPGERVLTRIGLCGFQNNKKLPLFYPRDTPFRMYSFGDLVNTIEKFYEDYHDAFLRGDDNNHVDFQRWFVEVRRQPRGYDEMLGAPLPPIERILPPNTLSTQYMFIDPSLGFKKKASKMCLLVSLYLGQDNERIAGYKPETWAKRALKWFFVLNKKKNFTKQYKFAIPEHEVIEVFFKRLAHSIYCVYILNPSLQWKRIYYFCTKTMKMVCVRAIDNVMKIPDEVKTCRVIRIIVFDNHGVLLIPKTPYNLAKYRAFDKHPVSLTTRIPKHTQHLSLIHI